MSDTWLSPDEGAELTERKRWTAQCRMLAEMGVPFTPNAVGRPLVERAAVLQGEGAEGPPQGRTELERDSWEGRVSMRDTCRRT